MLRFKKSSSLDKAELNRITSMATPKREQSFKSKRDKSEDSSSNKYLKLIKQASKIKIFDQAVSANSPGDSDKQKGNSSAVFRQVVKSLMKSKSSVRTVPVPVCRRDDSALQQQDGIQSAILHCKRSYSSSSSSSSSFSTISQECTGFSRCASESSHQKASSNHQNVSSAEPKEKSSR
ncbi:membrane-associated kinase regulator 5-like [Apium graveolens]|uniref:membrane-associated kinase regulator 5-like n=1 Tax=Apium graveolens TaxID=4045 RepID=UPI003D796EEB